jgi:hypothetical protein
MGWVRRRVDYSLVLLSRLPMAAMCKKMLDLAIGKIQSDRL